MKKKQLEGSGKDSKEEGERKADVKEDEWFVFVGEEKLRRMLTAGAKTTAGSLTDGGEIIVNETQRKLARCFIVANRKCADNVQVFLIKSDVDAESDSEQDKELVERFVNMCAQSAFVKMFKEIQRQ